MKENVKRGFLKSFENLNLEGKEVKMMKKGNIVAMLVFLCGMFVASQAFGFALIDPLTGGSYIGPVQMKYDNWEQINVPAAGLPPGSANGVEDAWGIVKVTDIWSEDAGPSRQLWDGGGAEQLTGIFYGEDIDYYLPPAFPTAGAYGVVGGRVDLYLDNYLAPGGTFANETLGPGVRGGVIYPTFTDGTPFASFNYVPGGSLVNANWTVSGNLDGSVVPFLGDAQWYMDVIPGIGTYDWLFDSNGYQVPNHPSIPGYMADAFMKNSFNPSGTNGWKQSPVPTTGLVNFDSHDPAYLTAVPEPASMLLLGSGLIGLAGFARKRFRR